MNPNPLDSLYRCLLVTSRVNADLNPNQAVEVESRVGELSEQGIEAGGVITAMANFPIVHRDDVTARVAEVQLGQGGSILRWERGERSGPQCFTRRCSWSSAGSASEPLPCQAGRGETISARRRRGASSSPRASSRGCRHICAGRGGARTCCWAAGQTARWRRTA